MRAPLRAFVLRLLFALSALVAPGAGAFEFFDGRLAVHGFAELQLRSIVADYEPQGDWDVTQWYNVLNVEVEWDVAPDGFGPFDLVSLFARVEARYDCVWNRACGLSRSVNTYGDRAEHLPRRLASTRGSGFTGEVFTGDVRRLHTIPVDQLGFEFKDAPVPSRNQPAYLWHVPGVDTLFGVPGTDGITGTADDPAFYTFERFVEPGDEYRFASRRIKGPQDGRAKQFLGPWRPKDFLRPLAVLADRANPFNPADFNPSSGSFGSTALPFRPAPNAPAAVPAPKTVPRGLYVPNEGVVDLFRRGEFDAFDQNFRQAELEWNRGASQQDEKELKEAYADIELFDSRLWMRLGKQTIIWGKTELFRTTDQFNPQDLALASLPSLEESRIGLWSGRFVYSFYDVGPLEDFRVELAINYDNFEPADLGSCGEAYTVNAVCAKASGLFAHGLAGFALAGENRPPDPWDDIRGIELGGRVEFRWDRFSFAISDFYGYADFPYLEQFFFYERNVDPRTGRLRVAGSRGSCDPDGLFDGDTSACLTGGSNPNDPTSALFHHHANQQRFAMICSASVGFNGLDRSVCAQSVFNSPVNVVTQMPADPGLLLFEPTVAATLSNLAVGNPVAGSLASDPSLGGAAFPLFLVPVNPNPCDGFLADCTTPGPDQHFFYSQAGAIDTVNTLLSVQQQALLGCGPFLGTNCEREGIDLLNAELSALIQSWPGFPGTFRGREAGWDSGDAGIAQPGTLGFDGGPTCTRFVGALVVLPGCRGPGDAGYDVNVDGSPAGLLQPLTLQPFRTEMAAVSWNLLATLVALSGLGDPDVACTFPGQDGCRDINEYLPSDPDRLDACSFRRPQLCSNIQAIYAISNTTRRIERAGGNGRFGRTDFDWHSGGSGILRYQKRNVLGFSADFAEDRTKSNWSIEATWIEGLNFTDNNEIDGLSKADTYNLTVSFDRPTFVNFLNANRTFFINSQWFVQYIDGHKRGFTANGPWNFLGTLSVDTGYFQDRLLPRVTVVYDVRSNSGALLPSITYRFTENFSATFEVSSFWGRFQGKTPALRPVGGNPYRVGRSSNATFVENGLSLVRDRDEIALRIRYTF
jgi:hypothetical protein